MSSHTQLQNESPLLTQRWSIGISEITALPARTFSAPAQVIKAQFHSPLSSLAEAHQDFDQLLAELEADPSNASELAEAGTWVAEHFYQGERETLKVARLRKGLSQKQLATLIGTSQPHIANLEKSEGEIMLSTAQRLCEALNLDLGELPEMIQRQRTLNAEKESK